MRLAIVDDQEFSRRGFSLMLRRDKSIDVVAEAANGNEVVEMLRQRVFKNQPLPDIILMDVRMPVLNGIEATRMITRSYPRVRVIVLTTYDEDQAAFDALDAGASGFLLKDIRAPDLVRAVHAVADGDAILTPRITRQVIERSLRAPSNSEARGGASTVRFEDLTTRERELAGLIGEGFSNAEISAQMVIEPASVRRYVSRILVKLDLRDRVQIAVEWHRSGLSGPFPLP